MRLTVVEHALLFASTAMLVSCGGGGGGGNSSPPGALPPGPPPPPRISISLAPIGPNVFFGGKVNAFAQGGGHLYVASGAGTRLESYSSAGIYRSLDNGATWQPSTAGLTDSAGLTSSVINALWVDPTNPSTVLAGSEYDGVYRSSDGGASWRNVFPTAQVTQFASIAGKVFATSLQGILSSSDGGASWILEPLGDQPTAIAAAAGAMYAGTMSGNIYHFSNASGPDVWTQTGSLPYLPGTVGGTHEVHQLAIDPLAPATVYASENDGPWDQDLHASVDGGRTWNTVMTPAATESLGLGSQAIAFSTLFAHQLYLGVDGGLMLINGDGRTQPPPYGGAYTTVVDFRNIWVEPAAAGAADEVCWAASDQGLDYIPNCANPQNVTTPLDRWFAMPTMLARDFIILPNGTTIAVSMQDFSSGALSLDGGATWPGYANPPASLNVYEDGFLAFRPSNPSACYEYDEIGLNVSADGCHSFQPQSTQQTSISASRLLTEAIAFDPANPATMYLVSTSALDGSGAITGVTTPNGIFKSTDGGTSFSQMAWPQSNPGGIEIDSRNNAHIVVPNLDGGTSASLSVTFDGGATWTRSAGVPAAAFWYSVTISPVDGQTILATNVDAQDNVFVLRSTDGGRTFATMGTVTNAPLTYGRRETRSAILAQRGIQRSARTPEAYQPQNHARAFVYSPAREILFNPDVRSGTPYAVLTTRRGAFVSTDLGATWQRIDTATIAHSFWRARWYRGSLYLASDGQGILKSTAVVQPP